MKISRRILRFPFYIVMAVVFFCYVTGCDRKPSPEMTILREYNRMLDESVDSGMPVLRMLDSLNLSSSSEEERMYGSFLRMKASDKGMIVAKNDSLYRYLRNYYSDSTAEIYSEILYYGGRTYSDLGDYPRALAYYDSVLELTHNQPALLKLRGHTLAQKCWILGRINLVDERIRCVMESIKIDSLHKDSVNLMYDLDILASSYLDKKEFDKARKYFRQSQSLAKGHDSSQFYKMDIYLAGVDFHQGKTTEAYDRIRKMKKPKEYKAPFLIYAAWIYDALEKTDTALMYASRLVADTTLFNREHGYHLLLSEKYSHLLDREILLKYVNEYQELLYKNLATSMMQQTWLQNAHYNYSVHDRERAEAESKSATLRWVLVCVIILALVILVGFLYFRYRKQKEILDLQKELQRLTDIENAVEKKKTESLPLDSATLRERINSKRVALAGKARQRQVLADGILTATAYQKLQKRIADKKPIPDDDPLWNQLEKLIEKEYPDFLRNIRILIGKPLQPPALRVVILTRLGLSATIAGLLLSKEKGTISYWRKKLCVALLGVQTSSGELENIIAAL